MNETVKQALQKDHLVDITTKGRKTGNPQKFEIVLRRHGGKYYIAGRPLPKDWYANIQANPDITLHLKERVQVDLPATARVVSDKNARRELFPILMSSEIEDDDLEDWVARAKLIEIVVESVPG